MDSLRSRFQQNRSHWRQVFGYMHEVAEEHQTQSTKERHEQDEMNTQIKFKKKMNKTHT